MDCTELTDQERTLMQCMERMQKIRFYRLHPEITPAEFRLLGIIASHPEGITVSGLAKMLGMPMPGVSRMMRGLESRGYIERRILPEDRRSIQVFITPVGMDAFQTFAGRLHGYFTDLLENVNTDDFYAMIRYWNGIMTKMEVLLEEHLERLEEESEKEGKGSR